MAERHIPSVVIWGDGSGSTFNATAEAVHGGLADLNIVGVITTDPKAGILDHVARANAEFGMDIEPFVVAGTAGRRQDEEAQREVLRFLERRECANLALMGAMVIIGGTIIRELNGPEAAADRSLPRTLEEARERMVPSSDGRGFWLPSDFTPATEAEVAPYGVTNTHPAPTTVTANTHSLGAQQRVVDLYAREDAVTYHGAGLGIDTGPIIAIAGFLVDPVSPDASKAEREAAAKRYFKQAQVVEKATLPRAVAAQALRHELYLSA